MQFQRLNRTNAETAFGVFQNVTGGTVSGNYPVCFATGTGSNDGYKAVAPAADVVNAFAGICDVDVADLGVTRYQCYGYRDSVRVFAHGTSVTIATGMAIGPGAASNGVS